MGLGLGRGSIGTGIHHQDRRPLERSLSLESRPSEWASIGKLSMGRAFVIGRVSIGMGICQWASIGRPLVQPLLSNLSSHVYIFPTYSMYLGI